MIIENNIIEIVSRLSHYKDNIAGKTFLITGGAGFLGKNIVWALQEFNKQLEDKCNIIVMDNYITGLENQFDIDDNLKVLQQDISIPFEVEEDVDYLLHAAGIASPVFYSKYKLETIQCTIQGTQNMLDIAKTKKCKGMLFFSTSEVYGNPTDENVPTKESYNGNVSCIGPRAHYDEPKRVAETLCVTYADIFDLNINIVRPFNVYGPGMRLDDGRGLINIVKSAILNKDLPIYGDGLSTRTWTYITDAVVGFMEVLFAGNGGAYNVGQSKPEISTLDLAKSIKQHSKSKSKIIITESPVKCYEKDFDVHRRCADISKITSATHWKPTVSLNDGLKRTIKWVEMQLLKKEYCRACGSYHIHPIVDLGKSPLANNLLDSDSNLECDVYPLALNLCHDCYNVQLSCVVPADEMFKKYLYVSSTSESFKKHFKDAADKYISEFDLDHNAFIIDIGSNDGIGLKPFINKGIRVLGIDPASNVCDIAIRNGVPTINDYFTDKIAKDIIKQSKADIVLASNVFAHADDLESIAKNVFKVLKDDGCFIIEVQYLLDTINDGTFDNIYHEHTNYWSVTSLNNFFNRLGFNIAKVEHINTHGGSIRVYVKKEGSLDNSLEIFLQEELAQGLTKPETYLDFASKIKERKSNVLSILQKIKNDGHKIIGYGAPAKATTLLNAFEIDNSILDYVIDDNSLKHGKTIPKVNIPIYSKEKIDSDIKYVVILAWNFYKEIINNNKDLLDRGVEFIVPTQDVKIINKNNYKTEISNA